MNTQLYRIGNAPWPTGRPGVPLVCDVPLVAETPGAYRNCAGVQLAVEGGYKDDKHGNKRFG